MTDETIRFDDGASYELLMGRWSLLVGERFIDWIDVPKRSRWLDVGCGNGAFTELLVERCMPAQVQAFDPSPGQLAYARTRLPAAAPVTWAEADAMSLPVTDGSSDAAVMALVLFFVPEPAVGLAEMCRAVRSGGVVAAYHWDVLGGGFPLAAIGAEMLKLGIPPRMPPSVAASTIEASTTLWQDAGLRDVRTCQITVQRSFDRFDDYWNSAATSNTLRPMFDALTDERREQLKANVQRRLRAGDGPLTLSARSNAISGIKP
ncbi:class I SAM-dependent methyltransferase [Rivibacter subsaxonicus]|uniref:Methyltransferase family protein n=1 Tax=Rivibacter subsaxonicus TaxID=457575 RepID=A0A4Q7VNW9_9BURK|nr:class I SAM-dependent methyltransferase [Rivibacter subsaxonicus]RZT98090.1 methyltransferase family protein [Rivibacter subsaxonicus]